MLNRYQNRKILEKSDIKKKYLESTIYPKIKASNNDTYLITEAGDRLDLLADVYYGDVGYWWIIAIANNLHDAFLSMQPGIQIRIPSNLSAILNDFNKINS
jgi:hypothetical protein